MVVIHRPLRTARDTWIVASPARLMIKVGVVDVWRSPRNAMTARFTRLLEPLGFTRVPCQSILRNVFGIVRAVQRRQRCRGAVQTLNRTHLVTRLGGTYLLPDEPQNTRHGREQSW